MIFIRSNRYDRIGNISMPLAKQWPECVFVMNGIQGKRERQMEGKDTMRVAKTCINCFLSTEMVVIYESFSRDLRVDFNIGPIVCMYSTIS